MTPRPRGAQCGFSPCGVLVLAVYIGFTDVGILFWLLRGMFTLRVFSHMRVILLRCRRYANHSCGVSKFMNNLRLLAHVENL